MKANHGLISAEANVRNARYAGAKTNRSLLDHHDDARVGWVIDFETEMREANHGLISAEANAVTPRYAGAKTIRSLLDHHHDARVGWVIDFETEMREANHGLISAEANAVSVMLVAVNDRHRRSADGLAA
jgi:hypothetical protein